MVLQRDRPVPIWGEAAPGESIRVEFNSQSKTTAADVAGHWKVTLEPLVASDAPRTLTIRGTNTLTYSDVLVGEVWFCSGQSNMEKPFGPRKGQRPVDNYEIEVAAANYPKLRLFQVPRTDLKQAGPGVFHWLPCSPEALRTSDFSAAAYYFAQQIHQTLGVPVGIIHSSFGGTRIEAWMPHEAYAEPSLQGLETQRYFAWVKGVQPTELFKSMVSPYAPYATRGFLWYQGEANCLEGDVALYAAKQTALIKSWREAWKIEDAPFYGVLLAPFDYSKWKKVPITTEGLPAFWEEQIKALSAPHTGYAVTTDLVANFHDIHPTNKRDVGLRLARLALADTYGRSDFVAHGPTFASGQTSGNSFELSFNHAEGLRTRDGLAPSGFSVAGADRIFHTADAKIESGNIIVSSSDVSAPVAVRFAWHETPATNLVNAAGLPAVPFRTDNWPLSYLRLTEETPAAIK